MRYLTRLICSLGCLLGLASMSSSASAQVTSLPTAGGLTYIGMITFTTTPFVAAVTRTPSGNCLLGAVTPEGGLTRNTTVQGGSAVDDIRVFSWDVSFCGYTITPLRTNGFQLTVRGGGGNDRIENYSLRGIIYGDEGNDLLLQWEGDARGGAGHDDLFGDSSDRLFGDAGSDDFNTQGGEALLVDGAETLNDLDRLCGLAQVKRNIEQETCNF